MEGRTSKDIQETQGKDNELAGTIATQKRRKIQSGNRCIWTYYRKRTGNGN